MHTHPCLVLTIVSSFSIPAFAQSASATHWLEAQQAYAAKNYPRCSERFLEAAKTALPTRRAELYYDAACCLALAGKREQALEQLEAAAAAELGNASRLTSDPDLASLKTSPRFTAVLRQVEQRDVQVENAKEPALKKELLAMVEVDQRVRNETMQHHDEKTIKHEEEVDRAHTARLKEIVAKYGWPGESLVGRRAAQSAWLLAQHADRDLPFQKQVLALMQAAAAKHDVSGINLAYLADRVAAAEGKGQRYGTQFIGQYPDLKPKDIEDDAHVDERRAALGLNSMADYALELKTAYSPDADKMK